MNIINGFDYYFIVVVCSHGKNNNSQTYLAN